MSSERIREALERTPSVRELWGRLPDRGSRLTLGGLPGSSPAVLVAWLAERRPTQLITVVTSTPTDAERWIADLAHLTTAPVGLYPQREALGEEEPHLEIAGERVETLEALLNGELRLLVTTARATLPPPSVPAASPLPRDVSCRSASWCRNWRRWDMRGCRW